VEEYMKKKFFIIFLGTFIGMSSFSLGFSFGPFANEQYLIENDRQFNIGFYDFPLFIGGIYHKINFSNNIFYYTDLTFNIHNSSFEKYYESGIDMNNYFIYFHNDLNIYPFKQKWIYIGAGMELIVIDRIFSGKAAEYNGLNYYITTNYFCYIDGGINISLGKIEFGIKTLYRILPFSINNRIGNGEITFLIGLK
jgi:hypothetical protein